MRVPSRSRQCVVFIGECSTGTFRPRATGFLVLAWDPGSDWQFPYLVTAEHVISGLQSNNMEIYCRLNTKNGGAAVESLASSKWWSHPDHQNLTDVAVAAIGINRDYVDHDWIPLPYTGWQAPLSLTGKQFGLGEEVFILGLFRSHYGRERNVPIVRIGNISAMPEEPIHTGYCGFIDAYLIEARSIAGLSGSPVFVNQTGNPAPGSFLVDPRSLPQDQDEMRWSRYTFLGLMHGHFDVKNLSEDTVVEDGLQGGINTGIGVVVPAEKVLETLYQPELIAERQQRQKEIRAATGTTSDGIC